MTRSTQDLILDALRRADLVRSWPRNVIVMAVSVAQADQQSALGSDVEDLEDDHDNEMEVGR